MTHKKISEKIANLSPEEKNALLKKLQQTLQKEGSAVSSIYNPLLPFGYDILIPNFSKIQAHNYTIDPPGPNQVQIQVKAVGLNFRDLMIALNRYPQTPGIPSTMGSDYAGVVTACGEHVSQFKSGDEVIALYEGTSSPYHFSTHVNVYDVQICQKPKNISFREASCIPTVFLTAFHGLCNLGRLAQGESVLIHSATGGVGLAAIQIARWKKAQIFATAGSDEKRAYLRSIGISHPLHSRTLDFADAIMESTDGKGIDVILNTLPGEALEKGLEILKIFGRLVQIDKTEIYQNNSIELKSFKKALSFSFLDLSLFYLNETIKLILQRVKELFEDGSFQPLPYKFFHHTEINQALLYMAQGKHIGKIVIGWDI
jgi:phthiocerol/phenolphthiocerol synthesis type-I polyketide synthase C